MHHHLPKISQLPSCKRLSLHHELYNPDGLHTINELPDTPAVYAITGLINGQPANCRYLAHTDNLRASIERHFSTNEADALLCSFMQSIKLKEVVYRELSASDDSNTILTEWEKILNPKNTEELNTVY